jgi:hypothetical protein
MEDAHTTVLKLDPQTNNAFFAVFDGHGGVYWLPWTLVLTHPLFQAPPSQSMQGRMFMNDSSRTLDTRARTTKLLSNAPFSESTMIYALVRALEPCIFLQLILRRSRLLPRSFGMYCGCSAPYRGQDSSRASFVHVHSLRTSLLMYYNYF